MINSRLPVARICLGFVMIVLAQSAGAMDPWELNRQLGASVDLEKVQLSGVGKFIPDAFWPSQEVLRDKRVGHAENPASDIEQLKDSLKKVLKPDYRPSESVWASDLIAVKELRDGNDYLLLQYDVGHGNVRVADGKKINVLWTPNTESKRPLSELSAYVEEVAGLLLNSPVQDASGRRLAQTVCVSRLDIGASKFGSTWFGVCFHPERVNHWYSHILWWSDGRSVLFSMDRLELTYGITDISRWPSLRDFVKVPRKFGQGRRYPDRVAAGPEVVRPRLLPDAMRNQLKTSAPFTQAGRRVDSEKLLFDMTRGADEVGLAPDRAQAVAQKIAPEFRAYMKFFLKPDYVPPEYVIAGRLRLVDSSRSESGADVAYLDYEVGGRALRVGQTGRYMAGSLTLCVELKPADLVYETTVQAIRTLFHACLSTDPRASFKIGSLKSAAAGCLWILPEKSIPDNYRQGLYGAVSSNWICILFVNKHPEYRIDERHVRVVPSPPALHVPPAEWFDFYLKDPSAGKHPK